MRTLMAKAARYYGFMLAACAAAGCAFLLLMMLIICGDVLLRNIPVIRDVRGLAWSNELSEAMLYLITLLTAPWLLRRGQHVRVDIVLRAIPRYGAWLLEWACDVLGFACCLAMAYYGYQGTVMSYQTNAMTIKTLTTPEWWLLSVTPFAFFMLAVEFVFRMVRLLEGERAPRDDAVSTG